MQRVLTSAARRAAGAGASGRRPAAAAAQASAARYSSRGGGGGGSGGRQQQQARSPRSPGGYGNGSGDGGEYSRGRPRPQQQEQRWQQRGSRRRSPPPPADRQQQRQWHASGAAAAAAAAVDLAPQAPRGALASAVAAEVAAFGPNGVDAGSAAAAPAASLPPRRAGVTDGRWDRADELAVAEALEDAEKLERQYAKLGGGACLLPWLAPFRLRSCMHLLEGAAPSMPERRTWLRGWLAGAAGGRCPAGGASDLRSLLASARPAATPGAPHPTQPLLARPSPRANLPSAAAASCRRRDPGALPGGAGGADGLAGPARLPRQAAEGRRDAGERGGHGGGCVLSGIAAGAGGECLPGAAPASAASAAAAPTSRFSSAAAARARCRLVCRRAVAVPLQGAKSVLDITTLSKDLRAQLAERVRPPPACLFCCSAGCAGSSGAGRCLEGAPSVQPCDCRPTAHHPARLPALPLPQGVRTGRSVLHHEVAAADGTRKFLLQLADGRVVETVRPAACGPAEGWSPCSRKLLLMPRLLLNLGWLAVGPAAAWHPTAMPGRTPLRPSCRWASRPMTPTASASRSASARRRAHSRLALLLPPPLLARTSTRARCRPGPRRCGAVP